MRRDEHLVALRSRRLVPTNALVVINSRIVGYLETTLQLVKIFKVTQPPKTVPV